MKIISLLIILSFICIPPSYANVNRIAYELGRLADAQEKANILRACLVEIEFMSGLRKECKEIAEDVIEKA